MDNLQQMNPATLVDRDLISFKPDPRDGSGFTWLCVDCDCEYDGVLYEPTYDFYCFDCIKKSNIESWDEYVRHNTYALFALSQLIGVDDVTHLASRIVADEQLVMMPIDRTYSKWR